MNKVGREQEKKSDDPRVSGPYFVIPLSKYKTTGRGLDSGGEIIIFSLSVENSGAM